MPRKKNSHKGSYGHVLVLAGSRGMTGASVLSCNGALRSGAGLVTLGVPERQQSIAAKRVRPEAMTLALPENKRGTFRRSAAGKVFDFVKKRKITSTVLGPGIGINSDTEAFVKNIIRNLNLAVVLDADALNVFSKASGSKKPEIKGFRNIKSELIITPHPGELGRLLNISAGKVQNNRMEIARDVAAKNSLVCVLKGYKTVVTDGKRVFVNTTGNPGMSTGGCGDVLSGMIASLYMQVKEPRALNAALAGVYIHGLAGDIAAKTVTEQGLLAGDIAEYIPKALKRVFNE
ncbi:MAG: NAD(P)H-hydrate dehydratase [Endomicrobiales bacterium]|nr:NAD(P)H-hydrate dehydratase [Endomicrobiales bacterium]